MDLEHQAEIWPIKPHFHNNKISLKIVTCSYKMEKVSCKFMFAVR